MKDKKRAQRRHLNSIKKCRAKNIGRRYGAETFFEKNFNNLKTCQCDNCKNVRNNPWIKDKSTKQEKKNELS